MFFRTSRRPRVRVLAAVVGLTAAATTVLATPAHSVPSPEAAACPAAYPVAELTAHQPVDGLTVSSGNTPDTFTGEVLGVVQDGIAPGLDLIMVRLTSTEIDRVGGIWAGMSGSPVYAADDRLIGAVSYGLAYGPSPVAGVTPAADMKALIDGSAPAVSARLMARTRDVTLPQLTQQRLVTEGLATPSEATEGLRRLPLPMSVSGMANSSRLSKATSLMNLPDVRLYRAGAAPLAPADDEIFAGSNLAASMSYGDFSAVGTGTTTMVCDGQVVGFGHPFNWTGASSMTMHGADAIYIQEDPVSAPFKVSNPTGPVGVIDGDHMAGISGLLGQLPDTTLVHSVVSMTDGSTRTGDTYVSVPDFLPDATALAELANQDRVFDRAGQGSSLVHVIIDGTTAGGEPFTLVRTNRFASPDDISFESVFEMYDDVAAIIGNDFTDVTVDSVRIATAMDPVNRAFSVGKVERKSGATYTRLVASSVIKARAGSTVALRVTLNSRRNAFGSKVVMVHVKVPSARVGAFGALDVGQNSDGEPGFGDVGTSSAAPSSFDGLLAQLASAPRNDQLRAEIDLFTRGSQQSSGATLVHDVVQGGRSFEFRITR